MDIGGRYEKKIVVILVVFSLVIGIAVGQIPFGIQGAGNSSYHMSKTTRNLNVEVNETLANGAWFDFIHFTDTLREDSLDRAIEIILKEIGVLQVSKTFNDGCLKYSQNDLNEMYTLFRGVYDMCLILKYENNKVNGVYDISIKDKEEFKFLKKAFDDLYILKRDPRELDAMGIDANKYSTKELIAQYHFEIFKSKVFRDEVYTQITNKTKNVS